MNKMNLVLSLFLGLVVTLFAAHSTQAQCVKCVPAPPGWMCMAGSPGGEGCITDDLSCTLVVPCFCTGEFCPEGLKANKANKIKIEITDNLIREVGKVDPQMGIVLVSIRNLPPAGYREGVVNTAKLDLTFDDVESHLKTGTDLANYKADLRTRISDSFTTSSETDAYAFSVLSPGDKEGRLVLQIIPNQLKGGSAFPGIQIDLSATESAKEGSISTLNALGWRQI